jgi:hypothetical protein
VCPQRPLPQRVAPQSVARHRPIHWLKMFGGVVAVGAGAVGAGAAGAGVAPVSIGRGGDLDGATTTRTNADGSEKSLSPRLVMLHWSLRLTRTRRIRREHRGEPSSFTAGLADIAGS